MAFLYRPLGYTIPARADLSLYDGIFWMDSSSPLFRLRWKRVSGRIWQQGAPASPPAARVVGRGSAGDALPRAGLGSVSVGAERSPTGELHPRRQAGLPRQMYTADSRALCLPCLKAGIFCFNTTATTAYMSSFLFLTFCVYVFSLFGTSFFSRSSFKSVLRWLFTGLTPAQLDSLVFNAEKPGAFPQKDGYFVSKGFSRQLPWQLLLTRLQQGPVWGLRWCRFPYPRLKPPHRGNRAEFGFSPQNELTPPPLGGEG